MSCGQRGSAIIEFEVFFFKVTDNNEGENILVNFVRIFYGG